MRASWILIIVAAFVLGGCIDSVAPGGARAKSHAGGRSSALDPRQVIPDDWAELAIPQTPEHSHRDPKQHKNLSTPNFVELGYNPMITDYYGKTAGDHFCGDVKEKDGRTLSVVHSWGSDVAFVLVDVTDPAHPEKVGELVMANTQVYDIGLSADFHYVAMSTSPFDSGPDQNQADVPPIDHKAQTAVWRDFCTGQSFSIGPEAGLPYACGVVLVDISNVRNPSVADFRQLPVIGSHSVHVDTVKGQTFITVSVDNAASTASYYGFFQILPTAAGAKLNLVGVYNYVPESQSKLAPSVGLHMDGTVAEHPVTHQRLAWLAMRGAGFTIVNLDNPATPQFVANFRPFPMGIHSVLPLKELWDGRHYTILGEECGGATRGNPSCLIMVVDTTDPAKPTFVGAWTLPVPVQWREGLEFSMHYYDVFNRTLFVTTYHGGLWAIDLSDLGRLSTMPAVGVFIPDQESPKPVPPRPQRSIAGNALFTVAGTTLNDRPTLCDVVASSNGVLTTWDAQGGLYTLRFDVGRPAPAMPAIVKGIPKA
jgi:hypothetical protein